MTTLWILLALSAIGNVYLFWALFDLKKEKREEGIRWLAEKNDYIKNLTSETFFHKKYKAKTEEGLELIKKYDYMLGNSIPLDLNGPRRSGKTTRIATYYIDLLFRNSEPVEMDVLEPGQGQHAKNHLIDVIRKRLRYEHDVYLKVKGNTLILEKRRTKNSDKLDAALKIVNTKTDI